jgi:hypothetical protein
MCKLRILIMISVTFLAADLSAQSRDIAPCKGRSLDSFAGHKPVPLFRRDVHKYYEKAIVTVEVKTNPHGRVISAKPCSGPEELRTVVQEAAHRAQIKTNGTKPSDGVTGILTYRFDPAIAYEADLELSCEPARVSNGPINGLAIDLQKPIRPPGTEKLRGLVSIAVLFAENGAIESAEAVSGIAEFRQAALNALYASRFRRFFRCGKPTKLSGVVVFNFLDETQR